MAPNTQKNFNVNVSEELSDAFSSQVDERGYTKYRAVEGALRAFMVLPPEIQIKLIANNQNDVYTMLVRGLVDSEIAKRLEELGPAKEKFLALLTQVIGKKPRKKKVL